MSLLTRVQSGGFGLEQSLTLDDIRSLHEHDALQDKLFPIEYGLKGLPQITLTNTNWSFVIF
jgi:tRNA pseudouridine55 synthase